MKKIISIFMIFLLTSHVFCTEQEPYDDVTNLSSEHNNTQLVKAVPTIKLFVYKHCFFCNKVTDFLEQYHITDSIEIIDADVPINKALLKTISGKTQAPYLVDEVEQIKMPESLDIIAYISKKFHIQPIQQDHAHVTTIEEKKVVVDIIYDAANFLKYVTTAQKPVVILVATTWCHPCTLFKPIFEHVAEKMHDMCNFIMLDADRDADIVAQLNVAYYPMVICFNHGQRINPEDYRTFDGLLTIVTNLLTE